MISGIIGQAGKSPGYRYGKGRTHRALICGDRRTVTGVRTVLEFHRGTVTMGIDRAV